MSAPSIGQRWRSTTVPYFVLRGIGQGTEFVGWVLLARRLGAHDFGVLIVAVLICRYGGLLADWGASIRGVRDVAEGRHPAAIRALDRRRIRATAGLSVGYVVGAIAAGHPRLTPLVVVLMGIGLNRDWISLGREKGARSGFPAAVQGLVMMGAALLSSTSQPALAPTLAYACGLALSIVLNRLPPAEPGGETAVDGWMLMAVVANQVLTSGDTFLITAFMSASSAGIYAAVYRLPNGWLAMLTIFRGGMLPLATTIWREHREQFAGLRRLSMRWSARAALGLVVLIPLIYLAIPVVFGHEYNPGRWPAVVLLASTALTTAAAPLHDLYLAFGDDRRYAWYLAAAAVLNIALNVVFIPTFGLMGAAYATLAASLFVAAILWWAVNQRTRGVAGEAISSPLT
jgi:O-antigen/teichoic acid export membrane protein